MTGRTHDLAAFTALNFIVATQPLSDISLSTALVALSANLIGGLAPDIDQPTADLWHRLPGGSVVGRIITPVLGGHRFISHSLLGVFLFGFVTKWFLGAASHVVLVNMDIVWMAFMIGFVSHLVMDTLTKEGVPWLFPIPFSFGFPPLRFLRIKTSGLVEKTMIFPGLMIANGYIFYHFYSKYLELLRYYIK